ncbi:hypothetical protein OV203_40755 [Nannocystis sp. ILAH1]|uniref:hypothetical protein n=1 Tax=Nannocystis sp. ILAH1 TaxID=2996789 RepID=UPI00226FFE53|nr:hypothetical protein [Nannocystis sp. ILAH1]MCY0993539.1 hypothetical protein [Nannocystis sp. ILAH1]
MRPFIQRDPLALSGSLSDELKRASNLTPPIVAGDFVSFAVPVAGNQKIALQFAEKGTLLRFKSTRDPAPPLETPIPLVPDFQPAVVRRDDGLLVIRLNPAGAEVQVQYAAGSTIVSTDAIDPERPFGAVQMGREFSRPYLGAKITHPGGTENYFFEDTSLPAEAIAKPTWQPFIRQGKIAYRAASGPYAGRVVEVDESDRSAAKSFAGGAESAAKFSAELALGAIPYVGPLLLVGQAAAGRTLWGERLSPAGRVVLGLFALLGPALRLAKATPEAELQLARQEAAARGISEREALRLLRGMRALSEEQRAFIREAEARIRGGQALTAAEASQLARLMNQMGAKTDLIFSAANDIELIWQSRRYWGKTEGSAYGARIPVTTALERFKAMIDEKQGMLVFQGDAAKLFHAHEVEGGYSAMKRLLGQHKAGFGDLILDDVVKEGNTLIVTRAHLATAAEKLHAGQTTSWAATKLWGRRLVLDPLFAAAGVGGASVAVYFLYSFLREANEE